MDFSPGRGGGEDGRRFVVAVNFAGNQSQCHVRLPFPELADKHCGLRDLLTADRFEWNGGDLLVKGLYLDEPAWRPRVFSLDNIGLVQCN